MVGRKKPPLSVKGKNRARKTLDEIIAHWSLLRLVMAALGLLLVLYLPALKGTWTWNDDVTIINNIALKSPYGLFQAWLSPGFTQQYYPLSYTLFWIINNTYGIEPLPYHVLSIVLHAISVALFYKILLLLKIRWPWLPALLFLVHPLNVESVAWATELSNIFAMTLLMVATMAYVRLHTSDQIGYRALWAPAVLFVLALLAKTSVAPWPIVFALTLLLVYKRLERPDMVFLLSSLAIAILISLVVVRIVSGHVDQISDVVPLGIVEHLELYGRTSLFYFSKFLIPLGLSPLYTRWQLGSSGIFTSAFYILVIPIALLLMFLIRRRIGNGPIVITLAVLGALAPFSGFITLYVHRHSWVADRWTYFAMPILCVALATLFRGSILRTPLLISKVIKISCVLYLLVLAILTFQDSRYYQNRAVMWQRVLSLYPNHPKALESWATWLFQHNRGEEAIEVYVKLQSSHPDYYSDRVKILLGMTYLRLGKNRDKALEYIDEGLRGEPSHPVMKMRFGMLRPQGTKDLSAARRYMEALARDRPDSGIPLGYLGLLDIMEGKVEQAGIPFRKALTIEPDSKIVLELLADGYLMLGECEKAAKIGRSIILKQKLKRYAIPEGHRWMTKLQKMGCKFSETP